MFITVKTAFEAVKNGLLKEGGYFFDLTTPHFQFTSGQYPQQDKDESAWGYFPGLDAVWQHINVITSSIKKTSEVECLRPPGSKKNIPKGGNVPCTRLSIRLILVASVLMVHTEASPIATEEQPLTLTVGEDGIIPFACRNEQLSAPKYYTVKFEEKDRPFYIFYTDGTFDLEGLNSPDQAERFRVDFFEEGSAMSVEINIASVSVEDRGTYTVLLIIQGVSSEYHLMKRVVLIIIPPGPAVCFLLPDERMKKLYELHCHSKPGSGNSTLACFQNGYKLQYHGGDTNIVYRRIFWLRYADIPVSCCSHDIKEQDTITQTSCDQYRYPRIEPANSPVSPAHKIPTKIAPTTRPLSMEDNNNQHSPETTSYSGCGRKFDWPSVMLPLMAFFTYLCISNL